MGEDAMDKYPVLRCADQKEAQQMFLDRPFIMSWNKVYADVFDIRQNHLHVVPIHLLSNL